MNDAERDELLIRLDQRLITIEENTKTMKEDIKAAATVAEEAKSGLAAHVVLDWEVHDTLKKMAYGLYGIMGALIIAGATFIFFTK